MVQTTTTRYGNPKAKPLVTRETGVLDGAADLSDDFGTKTARYRFSDGTSTVVTTNRTKTTVTWAPDNVTRTTRYEWADKSIDVITVRIEPTETVTWENNTTKITVTIFANGKQTTSRMTVPPSEPPVSYTEANYPNSWASGNGGTVTAPSVSARQKVFGNGHIEVLESGTEWQPFRQSTLFSRNISDPNSFVRTDSSLYDLRWGTPDPSGVSASRIFRDSGSQLKLAQSLYVSGYEVSGTCGFRYYVSLYANCGGVTLKRPSDDVLNSWDQGWTGLGSKILVIDAFGKNIGQPSLPNDFHGIYVSILAGFTAINSEVYNLDWSLEGPVTNAFGGAVTSGGVSAVNLSFDFTSDDSLTRQYAAETVRQMPARSFSGVTLHDAVLVKAAGNDSKPISGRGSMTALAYALINDASAFPKTLLVGALDKDGSVGAKANKASYSNTPGADSEFQSRFVMANGTSPFADSFAIDRFVDPYLGDGVGTSYAAPRVAGYIGILRHKFPNLNAEKSSSIILDTARTDTLWCHPNCESSVVGRGEASLSRALAPVGRLR
jgi:hypothetical protein